MTAVLYTNQHKISSFIIMPYKGKQNMRQTIVIIIIVIVVFIITIIIILSSLSSYFLFIHHHHHRHSSSSSAAAAASSFIIVVVIDIIITINAIIIVVSTLRSIPAFWCANRDGVISLKWMHHMNLVNPRTLSWACGHSVSQYMCTWSTSLVAPFTNMV